MCARARVEERARDTEKWWGEVGGRGEKRDRVYLQVYVRESLCVCTSVSELKRENVSMFESERKSVCVKAQMCVCVSVCVYVYVCVCKRERKRAHARKN